ncbi:MAG: hypothetical protein HY698_17585 [Deltaproteobacteria bacterium]|nr:hypothetical protein [Deltaproteobacteria bacterium]
MHRSAPLLNLAAWLFIMALGPGCAGRKPSQEQAKAHASPYRFPHESEHHRQIPCARCHASSPAGGLVRPGAAQHAPCDESGCHAQAFFALPGRMCTLCHGQIVTSHAEGTTPAPYPPRAGPRALASEFSHAVHLSKDLLDARLGFHVSCGDCHPRVIEEEGSPLPGHEACRRCHGGRPSVRPQMEECGRCHVRRSEDPARARKLIRGDLGFAHERHQVDARGKDIPCVTCHRTIASQASTVESATPTTATCVDCHEDENRAPLAVRMSRCEICHSHERAGLSSFVAPRSHLPPRERPDDHTLAFRLDHAAFARSLAQRCARCHSAMSGSNQESCSDCHRVSRPQDHVATFREYDHGPSALTNTERCATCHDGEFCVTCHARPPRSHFPLKGFAERSGMAEPGHAPLARRDTRACLACHAPLHDCSRSGCHE